MLRNINAFTLGAQSVNPKVKTRVVWVNSWFDPPKESEAAQSLINGGADVLLQNTDSTAVLQTAEKNGKFAFGWDSDMSAVAPKAHLGSAIVDWSNYYKKAIKEAMDGTWKTERTVWGVKEGQNDLVKIADGVPEEAKKKVAGVKEAMKAGTFEVFTGPIVDNAGKERLPKDAKADQDWKDKVDFYVQGVDGQIPSVEVASRHPGESRDPGSALGPGPGLPPGRHCTSALRPQVDHPLRLALRALDLAGLHDLHPRGDADQRLDVVLERLRLGRALGLAERRGDVGAGLHHHVQLVEPSLAPHLEHVVRREPRLLGDQLLDLGREHVHAADDQHVVAAAGDPSHAAHRCARSRGAAR